MDLNKRIIGLKEKKAAILDKLARAEAVQAKMERKRLVKQKLLIGEAVLSALGSGRMAQDSFYRLMADNLAPKDLELFKI